MQPQGGSMKETNPPGTETAPINHINQDQLSKRWNISARTLEHWRWEGIGPSYLKLGRRVVYSFADIEAFEREQRRNASPPLVPSYQTKLARAR
jgi:hypothetical protein